MQRRRAMGKMSDEAIDPTAGEGVEAPIPLGHSEWMPQWYVDVRDR